jgi:hypothetical protein
VIAEPPVKSVEDYWQKEAPSGASSRALSLSEVVATLQVVLASRRAARNAVLRVAREGGIE